MAAWSGISSCPQAAYELAAQEFHAGCMQIRLLGDWS